MNDEQRKIIEELLNEGYAVTIFTPGELNGACPSGVEDVMVQRGWDAIAELGNA